METRSYSDESKRDAVHQVTVRCHQVREISRRLGLSAYSLYKWIELFGDPVPKPGIGVEADSRR